MSTPVDVLTVLRRMAGMALAMRESTRVDDTRRAVAAAEDDEAIAAVAEMIEALEGLDEAYCRAGPHLTRDERMEDRKRLIAARAALARVKGGDR